MLGMGKEKNELQRKQAQSEALSDTTHIRMDQQDHTSVTASKFAGSSY